ncbi:MAG: ATP synthase F1 subunit delta [Planctomycetes bacterium]|nr:ATP synthase F1 subunit delta [Planctomycetota bacterium]
MSVLSSRYAKALFQAAEAAGEMDAVRSAVAVLDEALTDEGAREFVLSRQVDKQAKIATLLQATAGSPRTFQNFLKVVVDRAVEQTLPALGEEFAKLVRKSTGTARCLLETARALDASEIDVIRAKLEKHFGLKLEVKVEECPELIGGFRATVEDQRVDASVKKRLIELRSSLSQVAG